MNHTDSLEVWASLHKNAGNHLHSQEDPLSKKEKKSNTSTENHNHFSVLRSLLRSRTYTRNGGKEHCLTPVREAAKETKCYEDRQGDVRIKIQIAISVS